MGSPTAKKYDSVKVFPSKSSFSGFSSEELRRAFFQTHTSTEFQGRLPAPDSTMENMYDVHGIGQRDSKYMKFQCSHAPLADRTNCEHNRQFVPPPLDGVEITQAMADLFKLKQGFGRPKKQPAFRGSTKYVDDYRPPTRRQAKKAIGKTAKPAAKTSEEAVRGPFASAGKLLETQCVSHCQFQDPPWEFMKTERANPPKTNLGLAKSFVPPTTAYRDDFKEPRKKIPRCRSAPTYLGGGRGRNGTLAYGGPAEQPADSRLAANGSACQASSVTRSSTNTSASGIHALAQGDVPPARRPRSLSAGAVRSAPPAAPRPSSRPKSASAVRAPLGAAGAVQGAWS